MTTEKMLQEIQDKIGDKTLSFGCVIEVGGEHKDICTGKCGDTHIFGNNYRTIDKGWISEIIGHPISLSRVLSALGVGYGFYQYDEFSIIYYLEPSLIGEEIKRKLFNENGSDSMLNDQSDETIQSIHGLLSE